MLIRAAFGASEGRAQLLSVCLMCWTVSRLFAKMTIWALVCRFTVKILVFIGNLTK